MSIERIGLIVHPERDIDRALSDIRDWAERHGAQVGQIPLERDQREVAGEMEARQADLVIAIGGDGTTLAAIRAAAECDRPILGVACGSLGVLTSVDDHSAGDALDHIERGDWTARELPALELRAPGREPELAFNDLVVARRGEGQVRVSASVDDELFARFAGDGCIVSTPLGSTAYTLAAGGPLLPLELQGYVLTALPTHGGTRPPLILRDSQTLTLKTSAGYGGSRLELDGQLGDLPADELEISLRPRVARVVVLPGQESLIAGLRRRGVIADSPRILAEDARAGGGAP